MIMQPEPRRPMTAETYLRVVAVHQVVVEVPREHASVTPDLLADRIVMLANG